MKIDYIWVSRLWLIEEQQVFIENTEQTLVYSVHTISPRAYQPPLSDIHINLPEGPLLWLVHSHVCKYLFSPIAGTNFKAKHQDLYFEYVS